MTPPRPRRAALRAQTLAAALLALLAADNLLLLRFLGAPWGAVLPLALAGAAGLAWLVRSDPRGTVAIAPRTLLIAFALALAICVLGGEGGLLYATPDWQIRDAVLADMATHRWPFAYALGGEAWLLRAPLGMYLLPALAGSWRAAAVALLVSNALRLGLVLALGAALFAPGRPRLIAGAVLIAFSGWDIIGTAAMALAGQPVSWDHLENWSHAEQYSSHLTLAFWTPQHALAGWIAALGYSLWRRGLAPIGWFAASLPLIALWSPLALIGTVPFAAIAGVAAWRGGEIAARDVALAALALAIAAPALAYLHLDAARVGAGPLLPPARAYFGVLALEVLPFALPLALSPEPTRLARTTQATVLACLLLMPLWQVGASIDFQMRASIMPLALLALGFADWVLRLCAAPPPHQSALGYALIALALGAMTPAREVRRALVQPPSPAPRCSLLGVWHRQAALAVPYDSYLARVRALPRPLRGIPPIAGRSDPPRCWDRAWYVP